jgi:hypothetical protein
MRKSLWIEWVEWCLCAGLVALAIAICIFRHEITSPLEASQLAPIVSLGEE